MCRTARLDQVHSLLEQVDLTRRRAVLPRPVMRHLVQKFVRNVEPGASRPWTQRRPRPMRRGCEESAGRRRRRRGRPACDCGRARGRPRSAARLRWARAGLDHRPHPRRRPTPDRDTPGIEGDSGDDEFGETPSPQRRCPNPAVRPARAVIVAFIHEPKLFDVETILRLQVSQADSPMACQPDGLLSGDRERNAIRDSSRATHSLSTVMAAGSRRHRSVGVRNCDVG